VGVVLVAVGIAMMGPWGGVLGVIGFVPFITGLTGWCPLYALFKGNTSNLLRHWEVFQARTQGRAEAFILKEWGNSKKFSSFPKKLVIF